MRQSPSRALPFPVAKPNVYFTPCAIIRKHMAIASLCKWAHTHATPHIMHAVFWPELYCYPPLRTSPFYQVVVVFQPSPRHPHTACMAIVNKLMNKGATLSAHIHKYELLRMYACWVDIYFPTVYNTRRGIDRRIPSMRCSTATRDAHAS